jgi:hypothetical protein
MSFGSMQRDLFDYRMVTFSQNGEENVIARVFEVIGAGNKLCCEFGAWDGIHLSNTRSLILDGWSALLIEGDPDKFAQLASNYANNPQVVLESTFVDDGKDGLANILERKGLADRRLDLLSIDVDGLDLIFSARSIGYALCRALSWLRLSRNTDLIGRKWCRTKWRVRI